MRNEIIEFKESLENHYTEIAFKISELIGLDTLEVAPEKEAKEINDILNLIYILCDKCRDLGYKEGLFGQKVLGYNRDKE